MKTMIATMSLVVLGCAANLAAQPNAERPNPVLDRLRAGVWMERGGFDSFEPASGAPAGPVAAGAGKGKVRAVNAGWDMPQSLPQLMPQLQTPTLTTSLPTTIVQAPVPVEVKQAQAAQAHVAQIAPARAIAAVPNNRLTPCADLRNKALRLRTAAGQCDTDISNGAPFCNVSPEFDSPSIPRSLSAEGARAFARQFESVVNRGSERACAEFGGLGTMPEAPARPLMERFKDAMDTMANEQVKQALLEYAVGGLLSKISYGPEAPWTRALKNHFYLDTVRDRIRDEYRKSPADRVPGGSAPYSLNKRSISENLRLFLRDLVAPIIGANMAYATGSINFRWEQVGEVDPWRRQVSVKFTANDSLRLGSQTRIPFTEIELVPDDAFGQSGPMHTVKLEWEWTEVISY